MKKIRSLFALFVVIAILFNGNIFSIAEKIDSDEAKILSAYKDSLYVLRECGIFEYDVVAKASAEVYLGHEQDKSAKFNEEICKEENIPFELTDKQLRTTSYLMGSVINHINLGYLSLLDDGEEFEKINKQTADVIVKIYVSSPECPEFKFEMEVYDKYVKINETVNAETGEIIPESYFVASGRGFVFEEAKDFCENIHILDFLRVEAEDFDIDAMTYKGEPVDYIEKLTFDMDVTEEIYGDIFAEIAELNETVKWEIEQVKFKMSRGFYNMNIITITGSKGDIVFFDGVDKFDRKYRNLGWSRLYDEETQSVIYDENYKGSYYEFRASAADNQITRFEIRETNRKGEYVPAKNLKYEFYKDSYEYNNRRNMYVYLNPGYTSDMKPEKAELPEFIQKEIVAKEEPVQKEEEKEPEKQEEKEEQKEEEKEPEKQEEKEEQKQEEKEPEKEVEKQEEPKPKPEKITVYINGEKVEFDQDPIIKENRTLVPMRAIFEALGAEVKWNEAMRTVTVKKDKTVITMKIDEENMYKNGEKVVLDTAPTIVNSRTLVPVRAIAESFGNEVSWDETDMRVDVE